MPARPRSNRTPDGAKKRWSADDRARRATTDPGRPARRPTAADSAPRTARRDAARTDAPRADRRFDGPRPDRRSDAPRQDRYADAPRQDRYRDAPRQDRRGDAPRQDRRSDAPRQDRSIDRPRQDRFADGPRQDRRTDWYPGPRNGGRSDDERPAAARAFREDRPRRSADDAGAVRRPRRTDEAPIRQRRSDSVVDRGRPSRDAGPDRGFRAERSARPDQAPHWEAPEDVVLERLQAEVVTAEEVAGSTFGDLGLGQQITKALADLGAVQPFPIQSATIPHALAGRDVLGRGRTGSGKTIAFGAALVERLMRNWAESGRTGTGRRMGRPPRALILAPTRELALQIDRTVQPIARAVGLFTTQIVGGVPQARQVGALGKGVDIVIGTPGRIEDLLEQRRLDLSEVEITVLDEADHMADLGFLEPIQRLLRRVPAGGQRLMFSATLDSAVSRLVDEFLSEPAVHEVADAEGAGTADHRVLVIEQGEKMAVLTALLGSAERSLVFARTRAFAEQLADDLDDAGVRADSLHGDLNQARRTRNLARFSEGRVAALVATDVAARGIHVDDIELVIHADAAEDYKTYLHRSGRTGRAGASGTVITLINPRRRRRMTELLQRAGVEAEFVVLRPGADPVAAIGR